MHIKIVLKIPAKFLPLFGMIGMESDGTVSKNGWLVSEILLAEFILALLYEF